MSVLVCGGAGYIGSHMAAELLERGKEIIIFDNFEKGHESAVLGGKVYKGDLRDENSVDKVFKENNIESVIDFAAYSLVGESVGEPLKYFENNVMGTLNLLKSMRKYGGNILCFLLLQQLMENLKIYPFLNMIRHILLILMGNLNLQWKKS